MNKAEPITADDDVSIKEVHRYDAKGLSILFSIKGKEFRRVSFLQTKELLWWKKESTGEYCTEQEAEQLDGIVKNFLAGYQFIAIKEVPVNL